ncbi:inositol hexaphosphate kinase 3 [Aaosphaeria arxii CBS 175.79]|uniref:Kinase n=1 Tax=Aaosphaeria arxii CBS 175.79 TaxID=1450172 RepID=A0A6A5XAZ1_9PLEO|nr:inositol hexaphosphate kinase 3 [Aaosphaeria arxii CBS 175.79]KAF2010080.1 inositol hexaphosphate kinase 3 [Aaosphaeria arxii CBS 175.79]
MAKKEFDPSSLQAFGNAAAGHDGVLSDASGAVVVKPCTRPEVDFYEAVAANHPDLAPHLPTFMGTLSLSGDKAADAANDSGFIQTASGALERLHGKKLDTDLHIVLENITHGFKKPNVLDLKLGAQLWDEGASEDKRRRLDEVAAKTTSGSLNFRIAGMRTYVGEKAPALSDDLKEFAENDGSFTVYNKMYGRKFNQEDVNDGFWAYVLPQGKSKAELERAREVLSYFLGEVKDIQKAFEKKESRMYSASILLVYEGDLEEYEKTKLFLTNPDAEPSGEEDDEDDLPKLAAVKMIDFAHASFHPGKGPDENAIKGIRSTATILEDLLNKVEKDLE